jgi:hypothetical protein
MTDKNYTLITKAYSNRNGCYIGDEERAEMLFQAGINPEPSYPEHDYCSIGFCEKEQKWYGWSHRARWGFGVGDQVKKGDIAYKASNERDWIDSMLNFWDSEYHINTRHYSKIDDNNESILVIEYTYTNDVPNEKLRGTKDSCEFNYPKSFGRGEWTAKTLDDAKHMAIDFADNIA